jgi:hypothetical protein
MGIIEGGGVVAISPKRCGAIKHVFLYDVPSRYDNNY